MKKLIIKLKMSALCATLCVAAMQAQTISRTIHIEVPGSLPDSLSEEDRATITDLVVTGVINSTDFKAIRNMAGGKNAVGMAEVIKTYPGNLQYLDLSGVEFATGGDFYYNNGSAGNPQYFTLTPGVITDMMFSGCERLKRLELDSTLTGYGGILSIIGAFDLCANLEYITPLPNATKFGVQAFMGCINLRDILIPEGVTIIDHNCFNQCKALTKLTFPSTLTAFGDLAFYSCSSLTELHFLSQTPPSGNISRCFNKSNAENCIVYVPKGALEAYSSFQGVFKAVLEEGDKLPEEATFFVAFDARGGNAVDTLFSIESDATIDAPENPAKDGFSFEGWYVDSLYTAEWDFATSTVVSDTTLYAKWNADIVESINAPTNAGVNIFPNPATDKIFIKGILQGEKIVITDISGKTLISETANDEAIISVSSLAKGLYLIKTGNNTTKFIKE